VKSLRLAAIAEATTLIILLLIAVPLKYAAGLVIATKIVGPIHGLAFLTFNWKVFQEYASGNLTQKETGRLLFGAFVPFVGFYNERWLRAKNERGSQ
jgi:integral membrane protein